MVGLSMVECSRLANNNELRLTIARHVLKEMIRLQKWNVLMIYRLNDELHPQLDALYSGFLMRELNKFQPQIRPIILDTKLKSIQIIIQKAG